MGNNDTVLATFAELVASDGDVAVVIEKQLGRWQQHDRATLWRQVAHLAAGLRGLGVAPGGTVLLALGDNADWLACDLAIQAAGARVCALSPEASADAFREALGASGAQVVIAESINTVDALFEAEGTGGGLSHVLYREPAGVASYVDPRLLDVAELIRRGEAEDPDGAKLRASVSALDGAAPATLGLSSGAEGIVRSVEVTHGALLAGTRAVIEAVGLGLGDRVLAYRPLHDSIERTSTVYASLLSGGVLAVPESRDTVVSAAYEIAPTYAHVHPRALDYVASEVRVRLRSGHGFKGLIGRRWLRRLEASGGGSAPSLLDRLTVTYAVLEKLGLDKARVVVASGSTLPPSAIAFWVSMGLPVRLAYALTESGGPLTMAEPGQMEPGNLGAPLPGVSVDEDPATGELLIGGPLVGGGLVHTGDIGALHDGSLVLAGRRGEQLDLDGTMVSLLGIETTLRSSVYLREAFVTREDGRTVVTVELVEPTVARWASEQGLAFATYTGLVALPEVIGFAEEHVRELLEGSALGLIDEVRVLPVRLDDLHGALTPGGKPRRRFITDAARAGIGKPMVAGGSTAS